MRSSHQKHKILALMRLLQEQTDAEHPVTMQQILQELQRQGIEAERKSVYDDLEVLRSFGISVEKTLGKPWGYFVEERLFQLPELKLLVDAVQSSKFITAKKSQELISKVESLASVHQAGMLQRQVRVSNRIKSMNESIYYTVDAIHTAILEEKQICFCYFEWAPGALGRLERVYRKNGERYEVSPWCLTWDDENYYLLAYDAAAGLLKHYRVDKMDRLEISEKKREGRELYENSDMALYTRKLFGMFAGKEERVTLRLPNRLAGVVADRFGTDTRVFREEGERFTVHVRVAVSPQFFGWISGLGEEVEILKPDWVRGEYKEHLKRIAARYEDGASLLAKELPKGRLEKEKE